MKLGLITASAAALTLLGALSASAQVTTSPDPALTAGFYTDALLKGTNSPGHTNSNTLGGSSVQSGPYVKANSLGVGYDPNNTDGEFGFSPSNSTAETLFQPFIDDTTNILPGTFQIGLHGDAVNSNFQTQTAYVSIFTFNPNAASGTAPIGTTVISLVPVVFSAVGAQRDNLYYSADVTLANPILGGQEYVLAISPSNAPGQTDATPGMTVASFIEASRIADNRTNLDAASRMVSDTVFLQDTNNADKGGAGISSNATPLAYEFYAQNVTPFAPVPEPGQPITFAIAIGSLASLIVWKRRRASSTL